MEKIYFTDNHIKQMCEGLVEEILTWDVKPTRVVGVVRGGCIPAVIISHMLGLPCVMLAYSSHNGMGDDKNLDNVIPDDIAYTPGQLIVDDICDSGNTMKEIMLAIKAAGNSATSATLIYRDHEKSKFKPEMYGHRITNDQWFVFPWEHSIYTT